MSDNKKDEFSLESILEEFGGDNTSLSDTDIDIIPEFSIADDLSEPSEEEKPIPEEKEPEQDPEESEDIPADISQQEEDVPSEAPVLPINPTGLPSDFSDIDSEQEEIEEIFSEAEEADEESDSISNENPSADFSDTPDRSEETVPQENNEEIMDNIQRSAVNSRPVPTSNELFVGGGNDGDSVIDVDAFEKAYSARQRSLKNMRKQLRANEKAIRKLEAEELKKRNITAIKPATLREGSITVPKNFAPAPKKASDFNPNKFLNRLDKDLKSISARITIVALLLIPQLYLTCAEYLGLPLPELLSFSHDPIPFTIVSLVFLALTILVGYDVYFGGCLALFTLRANADSLVFASSIATIGHSLVCMIDRSAFYSSETSAAVFAPVCVLSSLGILFSLIGHRTQVYAYRKSLIRSHRYKRGYTVSALKDKYDGDKVFSSARISSPDGYFKTFKETSAVDSLMRWFAPILIVLSIAAALFCTLKGKGTTFFWNWSLIIGLVPALSYFLSVALPYRKMSKKLARYGIITGGTKSCYALGKRGFVMVRDLDLFPSSSISITAVKPANAGDYPLALTAAVLNAVNTPMAAPFEELLKKKFIEPKKAENVTPDDTTGYTAEVEGHSVLVGSCSFLRRHGIKTPDYITLRTALCCACDGKLLAVYALKYDVIPSCDYSVSLLDKNGYFPILATRDINITPSLVQDRYGIPSGEMVYPPAELREYISDPDNVFESGAVIAREQNSTLLSHSLTACHRFRSASRFCLVFSIISSIVGLLAGLGVAYFGWYQAAAPVNLLCCYLLWLLPTFFASLWVNIY